MARSHDVLTTGEVASICKVAPRTVTKWFDSGQLRGYRIPGSKDRRIPVDQLVRFLRANNMPVDGLLHFNKTRVLVVDDEPELVDTLKDLLTREAHYEVASAATGFEAGIVAQRLKPHVILLDINLPDVSGEHVCRLLRTNPDLQMSKVIAISGAVVDADVPPLMQQGFESFLRKPFTVQQAIQAVESAMAVVY